MRIVKLNDADILPAAKELAGYRDIPPKKTDVRFKGILYEIMRRFPKCPECDGLGCAACDMRGRVKEFKPDDVRANENYANMQDFIDRHFDGDLQIGRKMWYELLQYELKMPCHECDTLGVKTDCRHCHGRQWFYRKPKHMATWMKHHGLESILNEV